MSKSVKEFVCLDVHLSWVVLLFLFNFESCIVIEVETAVGGLYCGSPVSIPRHSPCSSVWAKGPVSDISVNKLVCLIKPTACCASLLTQHTRPLVVSVVQGGHTAHTKPNQVLQSSAEAPDRHCGRADAAAALLALCLLGRSTARSALTDENYSALLSFLVFFCKSSH